MSLPKGAILLGTAGLVRTLVQRAKLLLIAIPLRIVLISQQWAAEKSPDPKAPHSFLDLPFFSGVENCDALIYPFADALIYP